jgi:hypothetical protein
MRIVEKSQPDVPVPNTLQGGPLWLMNGKWPGKICRRGRFLPIRAQAAAAAPIQKRQRRQSLEARARLGTAFA